MNLFKDIPEKKVQNKKKSLYDEQNLFSARPESKHLFTDPNFKPILKIVSKDFANLDLFITKVKFCLVDHGLLQNAIDFIDDLYKSENTKEGIFGSRDIQPYKVAQKYIILYLDGKRKW